MTHEDAIAAILAREQEKGVVTEAELRQQLADVTNERDVLREGFSHQAKLLEEDAETIESLEGQLEASEARNADLRKVLVAVRDDVGLMGRFAIDTLLAKSSPTKHREHILYRDGDSIGCIPESILDRNGQVALAMCSVCGKAESELSGPCDGGEKAAPATDEQGAGS